MTLLGFLRQNARWLAAGVLLTFLSSFGQTFFISVFAGEIRATFDLTHGQWGGIYTLGTTMAALVMVWAGGLTDVFRVRQLGPWVLVGLALACLAMALNRTASLLVIVVFLLRLFGQSMATHIALVAMARWFEATRGRALSIVSIGYTVGEAILPLTFVALMAHVDWHSLWLMVAIVTLASVPILLWLLRQERTPKSHAETSVSTGMNGRHWTRAQVLTHPLFWCLVPALLGPSAFITTFFFHQVHLAEVKSWSHMTLVGLFPGFTAVSLLMIFVSGWVLDKVGAFRLMPFYQIPMIAAFVIYAQATTPGFMFAGLVAMAITVGCTSTVPNAFWAEAFGTAHIGSIKAMATAILVLGSAIGPGLTGVLIDLNVGIETQFIGIAVYFALASALMAFGIARARASDG